MIRADGRVGKCTVALEHPENQVGYLDLEGNMHIDEEKNKKWYDIKLIDKCYSCKKVFSCMNRECPLKRVTNKDYECHI